MSHIERISNIAITDLSLLEKACEVLGLKLDRTRNIIKSEYWSEDVECSAIVTDKDGGEAALVMREGGGYELQIDSYNNSLAKIIGTRCERLCREYTIEAVVQQAGTVGMVNSRETLEDGSVVLQGVYL